jgi:hypothetical protein
MSFASAKPIITKPFVTLLKEATFDFNAPLSPNQKITASLYDRTNHNGYNASGDRHN